MWGECMSTNLQFKTTESGVGVLTLAREKALNSLSQDMISSMLQVLQQWKNDENVQIVLLEGAGEKAFCAGGDIKALYQARDQKNGFEQAKKFFQEEYELDLLIATYPKPIIVLMDGIVMGGGVGLSQGASHRIVTEKTKWSMPEMNISFFPDVGACYFFKPNTWLHRQVRSINSRSIKRRRCYFHGLCRLFYPKSLTYSIT